MQHRTKYLKSCENLMLEKSFSKKYKKKKQDSQVRKKKMREKHFRAKKWLI
jgi:hypothetical protein